MKVKFLSSACVEIIHDDVKILCDPWLIDGEYYGSWAHYPPFDFDPNYFNDIDFIYISHQHPDHFSVKTLSKLNKKNFNRLLKGMKVKTNTVIIGAGIIGMAIAREIAMKGHEVIVLEKQPRAGEETLELFTPVCITQLGQRKLCYVLKVIGFYMSMLIEEKCLTRTQVN